MPKATTLIDVLRRELKLKRITYQELARRIGVSESSVKRMFSTKSLTLQKIGSNS